MPDGRFFIVATREKALVTTVENRRKVPVRSVKDMEKRLFFRSSHGRKDVIGIERRTGNLLINLSWKF